ncbi:hypothetical protein ACPV4J_23000 [Photobacterium swingsii]
MSSLFQAGLKGLPDLMASILWVYVTIVNVTIAQTFAKCDLDPL